MKNKSTTKNLIDALKHLNKAINTEPEYTATKNAEIKSAMELIKNITLGDLNN